jgi:hypothetical protein
MCYLDTEHVVEHASGQNLFGLYLVCHTTILRITVGPSLA